ncbi:MAG: sodium/proton-translocating pyrophosphatase, partial [Candidatus Bathyarchaeia archaeon]
MLDPLISLVLLICVIALALVAFLSRYILIQDSGTEKMREIALAIKSGSEAYLKRQYKSITVIAVIFALLFALAIRDTRNPWLGIQTSFGFILGALCSNLAGYIAMQVAVLANVRTASAVRKSFDKALKIAFRGGLVFGLAVVSMSLLGITGLYL